MAIMHFVGEHVTVSLINHDGTEVVRIGKESEADDFIDLNRDEWGELISVVHMIKKARKLAAETVMEGAVTQRIIIKQNEGPMTEEQIEAAYRCAQCGDRFTAHSFDDDGKTTCNDCGRCENYSPMGPPIGM